ncbi:YVTN family beta-propeller protein [Microbacterium sp. SLBN-154]|uniref:choice-of-anchor I family protein n=1 Tax=Microbacterium sp. SLBN-154 TaxID=2768458 RepID=UPI00115103ED|nr:choice-of-anchor I family protein [Microbacterium sp. SLBN-154]TQK20831.1 YVTN family beta-propeller protein [Microbacterium sp. SLBN-154]
MPSSHRRAAAGLTAAAVACSLALAPGAAFGAIVTDPITTSADDAALSLTPLGSFETGVFDEGAAEIVAAYGDRLFVVNAQAATVSVLDYSDPTNIVKEFDISGAGVANSVAVRDDGLGVIALEAPVKTDPGSLLFFDANAAGSTILGSVTVGALPDMVTISADGQYAVAANEGEPSDDFTIDPEGSISVVTLPAGVTAPGQGAVATADFRDFEAGGSLPLPEGVRVFGPNPAGDLPVSRNLEPEYITVDGATAYVTLQEANSLAVVDLASATVSAIVPLGTKDHGATGAGLDASDRDGAAEGPAINIDTYPGLNGMYMPDAIDAYTTGGATYLVTANEGDVREWGEYIDESRVGNLATDGYGPVCADSPLASLTGAADLGRLAVSKEDGFNADEGCYEELYSYGARSFSIWNTSGELVWDSGDAFERLTAELLPANFNSDHGASEFDTRSDAKGPEPESVTVGEVDGVPYAFVGLERVGGIMVFDLSSPADASFVTYFNNRDFAVSGEDTTDAAGLAAAGDLGPEGIAFVAAEDSPTGAPLLAVGNEVSGSTTVYSVDSTLDTTTDVQVLTINDFHGRIEPNFGNGEAGAAVIAGAVSQFESENPNTLFVSSGDMIGASTFTSFIQQDNPTIDALVEAGLDLGAVGNHEFDAGFADLVERVIPRYGQGDEVAGAPYALGANVYLAGTDEPALQEYVVEDVDGVRVAFIGTVTADTATLVSPAGITEIEFGDQLEAANRVAAEITSADAADVVVLLTHDGAPTEDCATIAQGDSDYAALVNGASAEIDAIVSGHTHQPYACEVPVNGVAGTERPVIQANQYGTMLGKLDISVDTATGELVSIGGSLVPLVGEDDAPLFAADPEVEAIVADAVEVADELGSVEVGSITGDIVRGGTPPGDDRGVESSLGNLVADMYLWATSNESYAGTPAQIALMNPGGLRADLLFGEDGTVTYRDVANVQPFANTLVTLTLTGAQLEQVLEEQWQPESSSRPKLHLGVSEGFSYVYDPNAAAGSRILSMTLNGEAIGADDEMTIVTNSFLAAGGDNFFTLAEGTNVADSGQVDLAASVAYFEEFEVVEPAPLGRAVVGETPAPGDGDGGSTPGAGNGSGSGSGSGSDSGRGTGSTAGQLGVTGAELPLGAALGAALLLVAGGVLFALRRRTTPAGE